MAETKSNYELNLLLLYTTAEVNVALQMLAVLQHPGATVSIASGKGFWMGRDNISESAVALL